MAWNATFKQFFVEKKKVFKPNKMETPKNEIAKNPKEIQKEHVKWQLFKSNVTHNNIKQAFFGKSINKLRAKNKQLFLFKIVSYIWINNN